MSRVRIPSAPPAPNTLPTNLLKMVGNLSAAGRSEFFDNLIKAKLIAKQFRMRSLERCLIDGAIRLQKLGQVTKGMWWMPWRSEAKKDASSCDKLRGAAKKALIRRFPNGATRLSSSTGIVHSINRCTKLTQGTETSKYLQENKSIEIP